MSNNRPSDQIQIPGSLAIFVILLLAIGLLLLATSNIGADSIVRASLSATPAPSATAAPTVNAFAFKGYRPFASPDGVVRLEFPENWNYVPDQNGQRIYVFAPDRTGSSGVAVQMRVIPRADLVAGMQGVTTQSTPKEILTAAFTQSGSANQQIDAVQAGTLSGARTLQPNAVDQNGQPSGQALESILLTLDSTNFLLIQAISPTTTREQVKPIVDKMLTTLQVDVARAAASGSPVPPPAVAVTVTPSPNTLGTQAATRAATAQR